MGVVDLLEVFDVHHHERQRMAEAQGVLLFLRHDALELAAVQQTRELVARRQPAQRFQRLAQFQRVLQ